MLIKWQNVWALHCIYYNSFFYVCLESFVALILKIIIVNLYVSLAIIICYYYMYLHFSMLYMRLYGFCTYLCIYEESYFIFKKRKLKKIVCEKKVFSFEVICSLRSLSFSPKASVGISMHRISSPAEKICSQIFKLKRFFLVYINFIL